MRRRRFIGKFGSVPVSPPPTGIGALLFNIPTQSGLLAALEDI